MQQPMQGELFHILEDDQYLPEEEVQKISKQLVQALYYLHSNRIIHRDMKPQNILIGAGGRVRPQRLPPRALHLQPPPPATPQQVPRALTDTRRCWCCCGRCAGQVV